MKTVFLIYFGFNILLYMSVIILMVILDKLGLDLNLVLNKDSRNKTLQQWVFPYFVSFFLNILMYVLATYI